MPFSTYLADSVLNWFKGSSAPAAPSTVYISLHTADPGPVGATADVTTTLMGGRVSISTGAFSAPTNSPPPATGRQISNTGLVTLAASAGGAAVITHFGVWSAATAGNFLTYGTLANPLSVFNGDTLEFPVGQLVIRVL
ncbi:MAG: phage tail fiber protein [Steroidobacteraceae bacterium]